MPLRLGERGKREITIFELGCAPGAFDEHHAEQAALPGRKPPAVADREAQRPGRPQDAKRRARKRTPRSSTSELSGRAASSRVCAGSQLRSVAITSAATLRAAAASAPCRRDGAHHRVAAAAVALADGGDVVGARDLLQGFEPTEIFILLPAGSRVTE